MLINNIFNELFNSSEYFRKVYPYLDIRYFKQTNEQVLLTKIQEYYKKYNKQPSKSDIKLLLETDNSISENDTDVTIEFLQQLNSSDKVNDIELLVNTTEEYCQNRALENAILDSVEILEKNDSNRGSIEEKIRKALSVEFDVKIGTDLFIDAPNRYQKYIEEEEILPTDIEVLNTLLNGGFRRKSLHCFLGRVNIGKSLIMCHIAASMLRQNYNVLYISAEMSEDMIGKRIDANLLDIAVNDMNKTLDKKFYLNKVKALCEKTTGKLIIKEYPTSSANANHIRNLLNEIKTKRGIKIDVIVLDYLNIFGSSRLNVAAALNSYHYIKSIAEEMRGLAVEFDLAMITASQVNRSNANTGASEMDMTATSECIYINEKIQLRDGSEKLIGDIKIGDQITANDTFKTVMMVHHKKIKQCYKITLKSGKTIIISGDHIFPSSNGRMSINEGLTIGMKLSSH